MGALHHHRSGSGPTAVALLHGLGCTASFWDDVIPRLPTDATCLAIDLPGFGMSPPLDGEVTVPALGAAVGRWLAELGTGPIVVIGHSLGGMVAQELAIAEPGLVSGLALCCTIPGATARVREINLSMAALVDAHGSAALAAALAPSMVGPAPSASTDRALRRFVEDMSATNARVLAATLRAITTFDGRDRVDCITGANIPAVVVGGEHEANLDEQQALADAVGTSLVTLPGTGHLAPAEAPDAFVALIEPLLPPFDSKDTIR